MQQLKEFVSAEGGAQRRERYWQLVGVFKNKLNEAVSADASNSPLELTQVIEIYNYAVTEMSWLDFEKKDGEWDLVTLDKSRREMFPQLDQHLAEISYYTQAVLTALRQRGESVGLTDEEYLFSTIQETWLAGVAPLHDLLKYIAPQGHQILIDHELVAKDILVDWLVRMGRSEDEALFVALTIGDHENVLEEASGNRDHWIQSGDPTDRSRALFFTLDTLTSVFDADGLAAGELQVDSDKLQQRFANLVLRHLDPEEAKIFRPEWGYYSARDLLATMGHICDVYQITGFEAFRGQLLGHTLAEYDKFLESDELRTEYLGKFGEKWPGLSDDKALERIIKARQQLLKIKNGEDMGDSLVDSRVGGIHESSKRLWENLLLTREEIENAPDDFIFSGGACNYIGEDGVGKRNDIRDGINTRLTEAGVFFFDPQIEESTHGRGYDGQTDGPTEKSATSKSKNDLYVIDPRTLGAVTLLEIFRDWRDPDARRVVWFANPDGEEGSADFNPLGLENPTAQAVHLTEYFKRANQMRREVLAMCQTDGLINSPDNPDGNVLFVYDNTDNVNSIVIEQKDAGVRVFEIGNQETQMAELLEAYAMISKGEKVVIRFTGEREDGKLPQIQAIDYSSLPEQEVDQLMEKYKADGTVLRNKLIELLEGDQSTSVVYTENGAFEKLMGNRNRLRTRP